MNSARTTPAAGPTPIQTMAAILGGALLFVVLAVAIYFSFATLRLAARTVDDDGNDGGERPAATTRIVEHPDGKYELGVKQ